MHNDIHALISENYHKNIDYLQQQHLSLFDKIVAFENAVENGYYQERYQLEFKNGDFDIYDKKYGHFLYQENPQIFTDAIVQSLTLSRSENVFMAFKSGMFDLHAKTDTMQRLKKLVLFGIATGSHFVKIHEKFYADSYFIVEENLEIFRLSLICIAYYKIAEKSRLFFSIFDDKDAFEVNAKAFLEYQYYYNKYIKFLQLPNSHEDKLNAFHTIITQQSHFNFSYKSILQQYTKPVGLIRKKYQFLNIIEASNHSLFKEKNVLLLAPGPSLAKNITQIQKYQKSFLIVALSATLIILEKYGITPDIVVHTDGFDRSIIHFEKLRSKKFLQESIFLFSARTPQKIIDMFAKEQIFFFENGTNYKKDFGNFNAFCAGSSSYLLLIVLQVQKLYLLGLDLAVDGQTYQTHSSGYAYNLEAKHSQDTLSFRNSLIKRVGNFQEEVLTTPNFAISIDAINTINKSLKGKSQQVYNLSDGAYFENTVALKVEDIQKSLFACKTEKQILIKKMLENLQTYSQTAFMQEEQKKIEVSLELCRKIEGKLSLLKRDGCHTSGVLLQKLITLSDELFLEPEDEVIILVLTNYMQVVFPYIFDYYNTASHSIQSDILCYDICDTMLRLCQEYKNAL